MFDQSTPRRAGIFLVLFILLVALGFGAVYLISESKITRHYDAPLLPLKATAPTDLAEGERMARIVGCWDGCHGQTGEGGMMETTGILKHTAPTLSSVLPDYSDEELARLVRYGLKRNGQSAVGMSAYTLWALGDQDLHNIIAHLRRQPTVPPVERTMELTWRGRWALVTGAYKVSVEQVDRSRPRWGDLPQTTPLERGRYLANVTCTECHGLDFHGNALEGGPSLLIVGSYSIEQFIHLMRTAEPIGGRKLKPDMTWVKDAPFTDEEIRGIYEFLRTLH